MTILETLNQRNLIYKPIFVCTQEIFNYGTLIREVWHKPGRFFDPFTIQPLPNTSPSIDKPWQDHLQWDGFAGPRRTIGFRRLLLEWKKPLMDQDEGEMVRKGQQDLNISQRTLSIGISPTVLLKKISWMAEADTWLSGGRSRRSFPTLTRAHAPPTLETKYWKKRENLNFVIFLGFEFIFVYFWIKKKKL